MIKRAGGNTGPFGLPATFSSYTMNSPIVCEERLPMRATCAPIFWDLLAAIREFGFVPGPLITKYPYFYTVKVMKAGRKSIAIYIVWLCLAAVVAQGCGGSKKCGCGHDLNGVYNPRGRHR